MRVEEMIRTFGLEREVQQFVAGRVRELVADRHDFEFEGHNCTGFCRNPEPHPPHIQSLYDTVRYGELQEFCLGQEGLIPGEGQLHIVVTALHGGRPEYSGTAEGYWFVDAVGLNPRERGGA